MVFQNKSRAVEMKCQYWRTEKTASEFLSRILFMTYFSVECLKKLESLSTIIVIFCTQAQIALSKKEAI